MEISLLEGLADSPALSLAVQGWAECVRLGYGDGTMNVQTSLNAIVAHNDGARLPIGVMTFDYFPVDKRVWIYQSYVLPEYRGRGIYRQMYERLVAHAITLKARSIQSGTHSKNTAMRAVAKKMGRHEECVILRQNLPF